MFGNTSSYPLAQPRPIVHIDCDAFFTSVEQALRPSLKGKPVITGKERGIVACASYEAKALGVKRPMKLWDAKKMVKDLICLPSDYESYSLYSKRMFSILREFTPEVEEFSIDEAFVDLSGLAARYKTTNEEIARSMKNAIQGQLGLTVSAGLSYSKTLAKIASKHQKPDGFTVLPLEKLHTFLPGVFLDRVCGFGYSSVMKLQRMGLHNVWDYAQKDEAWARKILGKIGVELLLELQGKAVYALNKEEKTDYDSIGKVKTFTPASTDRNFIRAQLVRNMESAFIKLRRYNLRVNKIGVHLRLQDFNSVGCEEDLIYPTASFSEVLPVAMKLFDRLYKESTPYRLTGVWLGGLEKDHSRQHTFLEEERKLEQRSAVEAVIDKASEKYGKHKLYTGTCLWLNNHKQHVAERGDLPLRKKERLFGETFRKYLAIPIWQITV